MKYYYCDDDGNTVSEQELTDDDTQKLLKDCQYRTAHLSDKIDDLQTELYFLRRIAKFASLVSEELQDVAWVENATLEGAEAIDDLIDAVDEMKKEGYTI